MGEGRRRKAVRGAEKLGKESWSETQADGDGWRRKGANVVCPSGRTAAGPTWKPRERTRAEETQGEGHTLHQVYRFGEEEGRAQEPFCVHCVSWNCSNICRRSTDGFRYEIIFLNRNSLSGRAGPLENHRNFRKLIRKLQLSRTVQVFKNNHREWREVTVFGKN